jgi:hypothetical protein
VRLSHDTPPPPPPVQLTPNTKCCGSEACTINTQNGCKCIQNLGDPHMATPDGTSYDDYAKVWLSGGAG